MLKFANGDNLYFTGDIHGLHKNICYGTSVWEDKEYKCRKFDAPNQMTDFIINNINEKVKSDDHLFDSGDLLFHYKDIDSYKRFLQRFNCNNIYLLFGNHCHRENLKEACDDIEKVKFLGDYLEIEIGGKLICLSHYPMSSWNDRHHTSYMLHGHEHGNNKIVPRRLDVGIDNYFKLFSSYKPFSWKEIQKILK